MNADNGKRAPSVGHLLRDLADEMLTLARNEVRLVNAEVARAVKGIGVGIAYAAVGAVFVVLGSLSLLVGAVLLVGDQWLPADRYWAAALLVTVITGAVAAVLARRGLSMASPSELAPTQTIETLEEDGEWLKRQVTSAATSS
jgi:uncharacterized membrane protein YqjE